MQAAPGHDPVLVHRLRPVENRNFVALDASSERFAFTVGTTRRIDDDAFTITFRARGGPFKGPVEALGRCAESIAVDGDRIAVGSPCGLAIHGPAGTTTIDAGDVHDVALAGRYLAWTGDDVVVHDLTTGTDVLRMSARELRAGLLDEVAVQPNGVVAFSYGGEGWHRVAWAAPGTPGAIVLDAAPRVDDLRVAGGRVLYERRRGLRERRRVLVLRTLGDGTVRRLARFTARRRRVGDLDARRPPRGVGRGAGRQAHADRRARAVTGAELGARLREGDLAAAPAALNLLENRLRRDEIARAAGRGARAASRARTSSA